MSRTIIIPDVHHRHALVDQILAAEKWDHVILTGDQFDAYGDSVCDAVNAAKWVKERITDPRFTFCFGNHDLGYVYPKSPAHHCSGFTRAKCDGIRSILTDEDFTQFKLFHFEQDILFTHAGFDRDLPQCLSSMGYEAPTQITKEGILEYLTRVEPTVRVRYQAGRGHPLMDADYHRGGDQRVGGIIWRDFSTHIPVPGLRQIMGHTPHPADKGPLFRFAGAQGVPVAKYATSRIKPEWLARGWSLCLDTHLHHYGTLEDGKLTIMECPIERRFGEEAYTLTSSPTVLQEIAI